MTPAVAAPAAPAPAPVQSVGERLTRSEVFDLVKRAVEALTGASNSPVPATRVREKALELLGRPSDTLSERHFDRILHDAHDAEVIDLKRRGEALEVSRAVATPSVADQLNIADAAVPKPGTAPSAPAAKTGTRAGRAGFGKRLGEAPAHLLNIGVVESAASAARADAKTIAAPTEVAVAALVTEAPPKGSGRSRRGRGSRGKGSAAVASSGAVNGDSPAATKSDASKRPRKAATKNRSAAADGSATKASAGPRRSRKAGNVTAGADAG